MRHFNLNEPVRCIVLCRNDNNADRVSSDFIRATKKKNEYKSVGPNRSVYLNDGSSVMFIDKKRITYLSENFSGMLIDLHIFRNLCNLYELGGSNDNIGFRRILEHPYYSMMIDEVYFG